MRSLFSKAQRPKKRVNVCNSRSRMEQQNCLEEITVESESPLQGGEQLVRSEDLREQLQGNSERSQPTETKDDAEARNDFWSMEGLHLSSSHRTSNSARDQENSHKSGRVARKTY